MGVQYQSNPVLMKKKIYKRPVVTRVPLDGTISLVMMTAGPKPPMPRGAVERDESPFSSPGTFDEKPFG